MSRFSKRRHAAIRPDWLALRAEDAIETSQPIVDSHHHLYDRRGNRYLIDDMLSDLQNQHDIRASVYMQARAMHRVDGPEEMRPLGETEFANGVAAMCASGLYGPTRLCSGIVGDADLTLGIDVRRVLDAQINVAPSRFRGIRHPLAWDRHSSLLNPAYKVSEDLMDSLQFRRGFAQLAPLGLTFDAWIFFHQMSRLSRLARAFPETAIVLNHCGGVIGIGPYKGRIDEVFRIWKRGLAELADCPNVLVKLGGLGMRMCGFGFDTHYRPPSSLELANAWRPWMESCIEAFGTHRCMFESNFPVDKASFSLVVGWNAMKLVARGASQNEKDDLFWRNAAGFYRLPSVDLGEVAQG